MMFPKRRLNLPLRKDLAATKARGKDMNADLWLDQRKIPTHGPGRGRVPIGPAFPTRPSPISFSLESHSTGRGTTGQITEMLPSARSCIRRDRSRN